MPMWFDSWLLSKPDRVQERVRRLNQGRKEGQRLRGYHFTPTLKNLRWQQDLIGKQEFLRRWGHERWDALPNGLKVKMGRRRYVTRITVEDHLWAPFMPDWDGKWTLRFEPPRAYANDPGLVVHHVEEIRHG